MTATITGSWIDIRDAHLITFQVTSTAAGTPVGTISFEITNASGAQSGASPNSAEQPPSTASATTLTLTAAQTTAATINNNTLAFVFEFTLMGEAWIRMKYTRTSGGTGDTMSVAVAAKGAT